VILGGTGCDGSETHPSFSESDDILEKLLTLNIELAEKEKRGEAIVGPWAPMGDRTE